MKGQRAPAAPDYTVTWDSVRRVREPLAWSLLLLTAIAVLLSAWQLFAMPGVTAPTAPRPVASPAAAPVDGAGVASPVGSAAGAATATPHSPAAVTSFAIRASVIAPEFVAGGLFVMPLLSVILAAFAGGLTARAGHVVLGAVSIQSVTLVLGMLSWVGAVSGHLRSGVWFIRDATDLAALAAALVFTVAVRRSRVLRASAPVNWRP